MKWVLSKITGKIDYLKRAISLYYWHPEIKTITVEKRLRFGVVRNTNELAKINFNYDQFDYKDRLHSGHILYFLERENQILTYGWVNPGTEHILGELALKMKLSPHIETLYDFHTFEEFRGQGFYPSLLQKICNRNANSKLIYAFPNNVSSIKGIEKAGFQYLGKIYGYNKKRYISLIKDYEKNNI